ncbi:hypothetical protein BDV26DRAFT_289175 [Aspergillus bertholletiae]|uniref:Uncharacterized protein n=1 Tax=Aspergillus bertholletiae TaxID=1226010 RepID=A0A5N7BJS4_9EURO|nr:hypothetical protein BDV26DRAFT_289175 [Aspergillus bertholletiae]
MAKVMVLGSPFKTPSKEKRALGKVSVAEDVSEFAAAASVTGAKDVSMSAKQLPSGISSTVPARSEGRFRTPERQAIVSDAQEKPEMSGAIFGDPQDPGRPCRTTHSEETSPLVRKALRQRNPLDRGLISKVKRKLQFVAGPSRKKRFLASQKLVRRKSSITSTTNWWDM